MIETGIKLASVIAQMDRKKVLEFLGPEYAVAYRVFKENPELFWGIVRKNLKDGKSTPYTDLATAHQEVVFDQLSESMERKLFE